MNLGKNVKISKVIDAATAATGTTNGDILDMSGFEGVLFVGGAIGTVNSGNYFHIEQDTDSAGGTMADLEGTKVTPDTNGDPVAIDLYRPLERYVRIVAIRGASSTLGDVYAIQYGANKAPTSHEDVINAETHVSPSEGTI